MLKYYESNGRKRYAKTLYKPTRPDWVHKIISKYVKNKVPYFFQFAKGKTEDQTEAFGDGMIDRLSQLIPKSRLKFNFTTKNIGKFDHNILLKNKNIKPNKTVVELFIHEISTLKFNKSGEDSSTNYFAVFDNVRNIMLSTKYFEDDIVDMLVVYLFKEKKATNKKAFWTIYGDIVYEHIKQNLDENIGWCEHCHKRYYRIRKDQKFCSTACARAPKKPHREITCIDCGKTFVASGKANRRTRCDECMKKHDKEIRHKRYLQKISLSN